MLSCCLFLHYLCILNSNKIMILKLYNDNTNEKDVEQVVNTLRNGGLIIYPTDTIYGIGCDIFNAKAVEKICRIKGIDTKKKNLSFICADISQVSEFAKIDNRTFKILKNNLPGPFTFILEGNNRLPKLFKNKKTVGVRIPDNNIIRTIASKLGNPIMSTSVKTGDDSVLEYFTDPELIEERYGKLVDLIIDGGNGNLDPSTIVDCSNGDPEITRQGKGDFIF